MNRGSRSLRCRRSTTPITLCRGERRSSRVALVMSLCASLATSLSMLLAASLSYAAAPVDATSGARELRLEVSDARELQDQLIAFTEAQLRPLGLFLDRQNASMTVSGPLALTGEIIVKPNWQADAQAPALPLTFELRSGVTHLAQVAPTSAAATRAATATLVVSLQRDVWVATRRLSKGSPVTSEDLRLERRRARDVVESRQLAHDAGLIAATSRPGVANVANVGTEVVALRDLAAGDVVRESDIGTAPDVMAGRPVRVSVVTGAISVTTTATALADARVGDLIDVRLQRPTRTLQTRVTGPGTAMLLE